LRSVRCFPRSLDLYRLFILDASFQADVYLGGGVQVHVGGASNALTVGS
jgi:hypothetical protein